MCVGTGAHAIALQQILGHSTLEMVRCYVNLASKVLSVGSSQSTQSLIRWSTEGFTKGCFVTFQIYVKQLWLRNPLRTKGQVTVRHQARSLATRFYPSPTPCGRNRIRLLLPGPPARQAEGGCHYWHDNAGTVSVHRRDRYFDIECKIGRINGEGMLTPIVEELLSIDGGVAPP